MANPAQAEDRFVVAGLEPLYLAAAREGRIEAKRDAALAELRDCRACPRDCGVDRLAGKTAVCHTGRFAIVSSSFPHFGEENCLRGWNGSGTIFFSLCNLRCVFCQNSGISQKRSGTEMTGDEIAALMLELQARRCHNINLVTPEHVVPQVVEALAVAVSCGLRLPVVYNTSGYDSLRSLALLDGLVDIYMPDFKFWSPEFSLRYCLAKDYAARTRDAIREMHHQVGVLRFDRDGLARRGVLIRHLVMPGQLEESRRIFAWIANELSPDSYVNVMGQYRPDHQVGQIARDRVSTKFPEINRPTSRDELAAAVAAARTAGLSRLDAR